jgi:hypothetical protein
MSVPSITTRRVRRSTWSAPTSVVVSDPCPAVVSPRGPVRRATARMRATSSRKPNGFTM